jgi:hypothetical protein
VNGRLSAFLLLLLLAVVLAYHVPTPVKAAPGDILWAQSENISLHADAAYAVAVDGSGVYVVGSDSNTPGHFNEWRIEKRSLTTGAFDPIFNGGTGISEHIGTGNDAALGVAHGSGLFVVGDDSNVPPGAIIEWRIESRDPGVAPTPTTTSATTATTFAPVHQTPVGGVMLPSVGLSVLLPWAIVLSLLGVLSVEAFLVKRRAKQR